MKIIEKRLKIEGHSAPKGAERAAYATTPRLLSLPDLPVHSRHFAILSYIFEVAPSDSRKTDLVVAVVSYRFSRDTVLQRVNATPYFLPDP